MNADEWACVALWLEDLRSLRGTCRASREALHNVVDYVCHDGTRVRKVGLPCTVECDGRHFVRLHIGKMDRVDFFFCGWTSLRLTSLNVEAAGVMSCFIPCDHPSARWLRSDVVLHPYGSLKALALRCPGKEDLLRGLARL